MVVRTIALKNQKGFSLVELMVVVAIIGILAALAVPRFTTFQAKARQTEAKNSLSHIYTLQTTYHGDWDAFSTCTPVDTAGAHCSGFMTAGGMVRYFYNLTVPGTQTLFTAQAIAKTTDIVRASCAASDQWTIDQDKILVPVTDCASN